MGRSTVQTIAKAAKTGAENADSRLHTGSDPPRDPHQRLFQNRAEQTAPRVGNLHKSKRNVKAETAAESRCLPEVVYRH